MWAEPGRPDALPEKNQVYWQRLRWLIVTLLVLVIDQWTKHLAESQLSYARPVEILPILNMTLHYNSGAAFSFLADHGGWQRWFFSAIAAGMSVVLLVWLLRLVRAQWLLAMSLTLILGGAVGNLVDRVRLGHVVDFISVHYGGWYFPTFNVADAAISVGAALLLLDTFLSSRGENA
jgi:signal peptidase II